MESSQQERSLGQFWRGLSGPVRASLLGQAASLFALPIAGAWPWIIAWIVLNHAVLSIAGTVPRSRLLGPNTTRITDTESVALTFDDGPDPEVTPKVLDILDRWQIKASFFVIGQRVVDNPELVQRIISAGHQLENHTHGHSSWFSIYSPKKLRTECSLAQSAIISSGAPPPRRFRAPAGVRSPWLEPVLRTLGLELVSWSRRGFDTSQTDPQRVLKRLTRHLRGGEILLLHDGNAARTADGKAMVLEVLEPLLEQIRQRDLRPGPLN